MAVIGRRWAEVAQRARHFVQLETSARAQRDYRAGVARLLEWLEATERLVGIDVACSHAELKQHMQRLDVSGWICKKKKNYVFF